MAMKVFLKRPDLFQSLTLLAGHAGICDIVEVEKRLVIEEKFKDKLSRYTTVEFADYWNTLEIFNHDKPREILEFDSKVAKDYFSLWGLAKQGDLVPDLIPFKAKIKWYFGLLDKKYSTYAKKELQDFLVEFVPSVGHRLLHNETVQNLIIKDLK
jgi:hypothetical protein